MNGMMITIKDVARVASVSTSTVSRVVRKQSKVGKVCRAKVQKVIDDLSISFACFPELTTMHYPVREMANYAANLAIQLADSVDSMGKTHLFLPHLIKRDSVIEQSSI